MSVAQPIKKQFGVTTMLVLNVAYSCTILTFLFALYCYFFLQIKNDIFNLLLIYSIANILNVLLFYRHKKISITYNIMSVLAFLLSYGLCLYSDGINSQFTFLLVLIIFSGYLANRMYGKIWLVIVSLSAISLYIISVSDYKFNNYISDAVKDEFNLFYLCFLIILFGGVFGRLMSINSENAHKAKKEILQKNEEKAVMLKEIHHRVKNNLQVVNSLLRIQSRGVKDENVKMLFKVAQSRVVAMARLHEKMYNTENLKHIDVNEHFKLIINDLISSYNIEPLITSNLSIEPVKMSIDTLLPLSLIVNELVTNSLTHAFKNKESGELIVKLKNTNKSHYELIVGDNGSGISNGLFGEDANSTGAKLIYTFVRQLNGNLELLEGNQGCSFKITFSDINE